MNYWEPSHSCCFSLLGGIVFIKVDQWFNHSEDTKITYLTAFKIGLYQCLAMVPEFLEVPAALWNVSKLTSYISCWIFIFSCCPYHVWRNGKKMLWLLQGWFCLDSWPNHLLIIGNVIAFIVALLAIKSFIDFWVKKVLSFRILPNSCRNHFLIIHFFIHPWLSFNDWRRLLNGHNFIDWQAFELDLFRR
jgi:undecaprenyl-diphosphatase